MTLLHGYAAAEAPVKCSASIRHELRVLETAQSQGGPVGLPS